MPFHCESCDSLFPDPFNHILCPKCKSFRLVRVQDGGQSSRSAIPHAPFSSQSMVFLPSLPSLAPLLPAQALPVTIRREHINSTPTLAGAIERGNLINLIQQNYTTVSNAWAASHGIDLTLNHHLGAFCHIINPDLCSVSSPLSSNRNEELDGIVNYAKAIAGYNIEGSGAITNGLLHQHAGRPIIMILNTASAEGSSSKSGDTSTIGGSHWVACVVLPPNYVTPMGVNLRNNAHIICFIDSLYPNRRFPEAFRNVLARGIRVTTPIGTIHRIPPAFPGAVVQDNLLNGVGQQLQGYDCGWWAVYNAMMLVLWGPQAVLIGRSGPNRFPAYVLRRLFPRLTEEPVIPVHVSKASASSSDKSAGPDPSTQKTDEITKQCLALLGTDSSSIKKLSFGAVQALYATFCKNEKAINYGLELFHHHFGRLYAVYGSVKAQRRQHYHIDKPLKIHDKVKTLPTHLQENPKGRSDRSQKEYYEKAKGFGDRFELLTAKSESWFENFVDLALWRKVFTRSASPDSYFSLISIGSQELFVLNEKGGTTRLLIPFHRVSDLLAPGFDPGEIRHWCVDASYGEFYKAIQKIDGGLQRLMARALYDWLVKGTSPENADILFRTAVTANFKLYDVWSLHGVFTKGRELREDVPLNMHLIDIVRYLGVLCFVIEPRHALALYASNITAIKLAAEGVISLSDFLNTRFCSSYSGGGGLLASSNWGAGAPWTRIEHQRRLPLLDRIFRMEPFRPLRDNEYARETRWFAVLKVTFLELLSHAAGLSTENYITPLQLKYKVSYGKPLAKKTARELGIVSALASSSKKDSVLKKRSLEQETSKPKVAAKVSKANYGACRELLEQLINYVERSERYKIRSIHVPLAKHISTLRESEKDYFFWRGIEFLVRLYFSAYLADAEFNKIFNKLIAAVKESINKDR